MKSEKIWDIIYLSGSAALIVMTLLVDGWWPVLVCLTFVASMITGHWLGFRRACEVHDEWLAEELRKEREHAEWEQVVNSTGMLDAIRRQRDVGN